MPRGCGPCSLASAPRPRRRPRPRPATRRARGQRPLPCATPRRPERAQPAGGPRPGTGGLGAAASAGATRVACRHEAWAVGQRGPGCGQGHRSARPAGGAGRLDGHARRRARRYACAKRRDAAGGAILTAGLPVGVGAEPDSAQARAGLAVSRYALGVPGERWPGSQARLGGPGPDATQWDQSEVGGDCAYKVFAQMEREAAQGEQIFQDDTAARLLALIKAHRDLGAAAHAQGVSTTNERTGMHTTALVVQGGSTPPFCSTPAAAMLAKTSRRCWSNGRRVSPNHWSGRTRCRAMRWPRQRR